MRPILCSAALVFLTACGGRPDASTGPASPTDPTMAEAPPVTTTPPVENTAGDRIAAACRQFVAVDQRDRCDFGSTTEAECVSEMSSEVQGLSSQETDIYLRAFDCMAAADSCSGHEQCIMDASVALDEGSPPAEPERTDLPCNRASETDPAQVSPAEYAARHGAGVLRLAVLTSSKEQPVEVCGVHAQHDFLLAVECADGSTPFLTADQVRDARAGNVGPGGRCGAIVDLYEVRCPEKTYQVYMDLYYCPAGESI